MWVCKLYNGPCVLSAMTELGAGDGGGERVVRYSYFVIYIFISKGVVASRHRPHKYTYWLLIRKVLLRPHHLSVKRKSDLPTVWESLQSKCSDKYKIKMNSSISYLSIKNTSISKSYQHNAVNSSQHYNLQSIFIHWYDYYNIIIKHVYLPRNGKV